ncbi:MAG: CARDB domain-containing protein [Bacteroidota bacterium]
MKKLFSMILVAACATLFFTACEKEDPISVDPQEEGIEIVDISPDDIEFEIVDPNQATTRMDIPPVALGPDLVIGSFGSTLVNNGICAIPVGGTPLPNATCGGTLGGFKSFTLFIRVVNIGNQAVPPGSFKVSWALSGFPLQGLTIVNHPGIPAGGSIGVSRGWSLPCPNSFPIGLNTRNFIARVDVGDVVNETNENNNTSRPYTICDDL